MSKKTVHGGKRKGAGRKPANPEGATVVVAASVPEALATALDELADARGWNRSRAITEAIRGLLKRKGGA
jgi:ribbon-helix-helix CopG family protein